jgi:hypothetical protein
VFKKFDRSICKVKVDERPFGAKATIVTGRMLTGGIMVG